MYKSITLALGLLLATFGTATAQRAFPLPELVTVNHQAAPLANYVGKGQPTIVAVWATWCQPCHQELDHLKDYATQWEQEYGVQLLAVSVDKAYQMKKIMPLVKRKGWDYDILVDTDGQLQSRLGFRSIPQMYILDGAGKIVQEFSGYRQGREKEVDAVVRRLAAK